MASRLLFAGVVVIIPARSMVGSLSSANRRVICAAVGLVKARRLATPAAAAAPSGRRLAMFIIIRGMNERIERRKKINLTSFRYEYNLYIRTEVFRAKLDW